MLSLCVSKIVSQPLRICKLHFIEAFVWVQAVLRSFAWGKEAIDDHWSFSSSDIYRQNVRGSEGNGHLQHCWFWESFQCLERSGGFANFDGLLHPQLLWPQAHSVSGFVGLWTHTTPPMLSVFSPGNSAPTTMTSIRSQSTIQAGKLHALWKGRLYHFRYHITLIETTFWKFWFLVALDWPLWHWIDCQELKDRCLRSVEASVHQAAHLLELPSLDCLGQCERGQSRPFQTDWLPLNRNHSSQKYPPEADRCHKLLPGISTPPFCVSHLLVQRLRLALQKRGTTVTGLSCSMLGDESSMTFIPHRQNKAEFPPIKACHCIIARLAARSHSFPQCMSLKPHSLRLNHMDFQHIIWQMRQ